MKHTATVNGYVWRVTDKCCWKWDYSKTPTASVSGWKVTRQKENGKDGRAYPRSVARFFGPDAYRDAIAFFEEKTR